MRAIEELFEKGDFNAAGAAIDEVLAGSPEGPHWLFAFQIRARVADFDGAAVAARRLVAIEPDLAEAMEHMRLCVESERIIAARRSDPVIAGKRAALRPPPNFCLPYVKAAVMRAQGDNDEARRALDEGRADALRSPGSLTRKSGATLRFTDIVDADELTGPILPFFDDGAALDVPFCDIFSIELLPESSPLDALWAPSRLILRDGAELVVRIPALYSGSGTHEDVRARTGTHTLWDHRRGYAEGSGQRSLSLALEDGGLAHVGLLDIARIDLDAPGGFEAGQKTFRERMGL